MSVQIDRLVLDVPGLTPEQGRDLAQRIGAALARGGGVGAAGRGGSVDRIALDVAPSGDLDVLAARVVAGVRGQLD